MLQFLRLVVIDAGFRYGPDFVKRLSDYFSSLFSGASSSASVAQILAENQLYDIQAQRMAKKLFEIGIAEGWSLAIHLYEDGAISIELLARIGLLKEALSRRTVVMPDVSASILDSTVASKAIYPDDMSMNALRSALFIEVEKFGLTN
jgi:hypothetical protein